jgi:hypothetical protein
MNPTLSQRIQKLQGTIDRMKAAGADPADYADLEEMLNVYRSLAV